MKQKWPTMFRAQNLRLRMRKFIRQQGPYACMVTVNFAHPYEDPFLLSSMNEFIKQLNRKVFARASKRKGYYLDGICSVEVCRDGGVLHQRLHFHILIKQSKKLNSENAEKVLMPRIDKILKKWTDPMGRLISNKKLVMISPIKRLGRLPKYLTKEYEKDKSGVDAEGYIGYLSLDGIVGLDIPKDRKKRELIRKVT